MRADGGGASIFPDGGGTSFEIGGIEEPREIGADPISGLLGLLCPFPLGGLGTLGRGSSLERFFSSGNNPSKPPVGFSLLGDDAMSITYSLGPRTGVRSGRETITAFSQCARDNGCRAVVSRRSIKLRRNVVAEEDESESFAHLGGRYPTFGFPYGSAICRIALRWGHGSRGDAR
jgi:hypothetical protein